MITDKKAANAMGGKTTRACDGCLRKRARWFCAADDAFLCQACDISVHSANQLASRHERARLETASNVSNDGFHHQVAVAHPTWPQGFTRKARTPKQNSKHSMPGQQKDGDTNKVFNLINPIDPLVPEIGSEDSSVDENEDQVICRVPVFDPFTAELSHMVNQDGNLGTCELDDGLHDFLRSDMDLVGLAADVESLLEVGLDKDTTCWEDIKGVDLLDTKEEEDENNIDCYNIKTVKVKDEAEVEVEAMIADVDCCFDSGFESLNWSFDYQSPVAGEAEEEDKAVLVVEPKLTTVNGESKAAEMKRNMLLRLNYESVITAWASHGSPWTAGSPPEFYPHEFMGFNAKDCEQMWGGIEGKYRGNNISDREREARVSRYREKRRSRLFSKKIRYEVRKLNAEKRPRMKGRFVKRTSFASTQAFAYNFVNY